MDINSRIIELHREKARNRREGIPEISYAASNNCVSSSASNTSIILSTASDSSSVFNSASHSISAKPFHDAKLNSVSSVIALGAPGLKFSEPTSTILMPVLAHSLEERLKTRQTEKKRKSVEELERVEAVLVQEQQNFLERQLAAQEAVQKALLPKLKFYYQEPKLFAKYVDIDRVELCSYIQKMPLDLPADCDDSLQVHRAALSVLGTCFFKNRNY
jgi:hypothetical protein